MCIRDRGDQLSPAQAGLDAGQDEGFEAVGYGGQDRCELLGSQGPGLPRDDFRQLGVLAWVEGDEPVAHRAGEDECSMTWYLAIERGEKPRSIAKYHVMLHSSSPARCATGSSPSTHARTPSCRKSSRGRPGP